MRGLFVAALIITMVAAGCASNQESARPAAINEPTAPGFASLRLDETNGTEPNVVVAPDGKTVYLAGTLYPNPDIDYNALWRSDDGGHTFAAPVKVAPEYQSGDSTLAVGKDGTVYVGTLEIMDPVVQKVQKAICTAVSMSHDNGKTFTTNGLACPLPGTYWDRPWVAAGDQFVYTLQWHPDGVIGGLVSGIARSTDGSVWVGSPTAMSPTPETVQGPLVADGAQLYAPYIEIPKNVATQGALLGPDLATGDALGVVWSQQTIAEDAVGGFPILSKHGNDGLLTWMAFPKPDRSGATTIRASFLVNGSWSKPITIEANGTNVFPWAAAKNGHKLIAYDHTDAVGNPNKVDANASWSLRIWLDGRTLTVDPSVHRGPVCVLILGGASCDTTTQRGLGDYLTADLFPDGRPIVAYAEDVSPHLSSQYISYGHMRVAIPAS
jgi:hypothetical protein